MQRYRLRYQATDLEMPSGEFLVGRSSSCNLALDDALVSRKHARFEVGPTGVTVEDLGSRNGVLVNGKRTHGRTVVRHLDRVGIGSHEMILVELGRAKDGRHPTSELLICLGCRTPLEAFHKICPSCGTPVPRTASTLAGATLELRATDFGLMGEEEDTRQTSAFVLLAPIVEKAIGLGHYDEAAHMIGAQLDALKAEAGREKLSPELVAQATTLALGLAEGLRQARWFNFIFDFHAILGRLIPGPTVDQLHELVRSARYRETTPLRNYLERMRARELNASDRFTLRRLEGLERVISA
ncbi:MAG: FHA domain-containing protein [Deltaproteobacteria bacterium]|nr:FHA domain-containing protein [Deltaproteobacteria bacterium]